MKTVGVVALAVAAVPVLAGCGTTVHAAGDEKVTLTPAQARQKIDKIYQESFASVSPPLKWWDGWPQVSSNMSGLTGQDDGTAVVSEDRYILTKVAPDKRTGLLGTVTHAWQQLGFSVTSDLAVPMPRADATAKDGSRISVQIGPTGKIQFSLTVGNIADPGIGKEDSLFGPMPPQPTDSTGRLNVTPSVEDPYWSH